MEKGWMVMADREKVIESLEKAKTIIENWIPMFEQYNTPFGIDCAIILLKEQEAKKVIGIADSIEGMEVGYCPSCDRAIVNKKIDETKFCKFCGQAVKWDE
jgi:hypothetical protein